MKIRRKKMTDTKNVIYTNEFLDEEQAHRETCIVAYAQYLYWEGSSESELPSLMLHLVKHRELERATDGSCADAGKFFEGLSYQISSERRKYQANLLSVREKFEGELAEGMLKSNPVRENHFDIIKNNWKKIEKKSWKDGIIYG